MFGNLTTFGRVKTVTPFMGDLDALVGEVEGVGGLVHDHGVGDRDDVGQSIKQTPLFGGHHAPHAVLFEVDVTHERGICNVRTGGCIEAGVIKSG
jgi:hypothetical protein